jgi:hypothetical protein
VLQNVIQHVGRKEHRIPKFTFQFFNYISNNSDTWRGLTAFNIWLQDSDGAKASEKQEISKYFERETSPNPLTQYSTKWGTRTSNRIF